MYRNKGVKAGMAEARRKRKRKQQSEYFFDYSLLFIVLFLLGFGLIMIYSASPCTYSLKSCPLTS